MMDQRAEAGEAAVVKAILDDTIALYTRMRGMDHAPIVRAAAAIRGAFADGGKLLIFGNGGSAADAQHLATELVGRFTRERAALPAIALTTDSSILTAVGNDYGFERVFVRQIDALGRPGDVAFGISTSGKSPSVLKALEAATARGLTTVALTGYDGGPIGHAAQIHINVPADSTPRVQEVHGTLIHAICELVERTLVEK
jgi:D-sedoheptulose 7-phosphate isomerase